MDNTNIIIELVLSLALYTQEQPRYKSSYPPGLVRAMSGIALGMQSKFPKTFSAFIALCHEPFGEWYPYQFPGFVLGDSLLDQGQLTEQASDYLYSLPEDVVQQHTKKGYIPKSIEDNWEMQRFIEEMRALEDAAEAQHIYTVVRSFLIEHSWITQKHLRELKRQDIPQAIQERVKHSFYQQENTGNSLYYCDRCGILHSENERLAGVKPRYCDDHNSSAAHVHHVPNVAYARLRTGIHLRTFIPGRAEVAIFNQAEALHDEYPDHLTEVTRYPGLDTYDMRLVFRDEAWAVDVKDIADPQALSRQIKPMENIDALAHTKAFYVVPDRQLQLTNDYLKQVRQRKPVKPPLFLLSESAFCDQMGAKCAELVKASR